MQRESELSVTCPRKSQCFPQENAAERHELTEIMKVLKKQAAKNRPSDKENMAPWDRKR